MEGTPVPVLEGVTTFPTSGGAQFSISRNGSLLYAPGNSWGDDLRVISVDREGRSRPLIETQRRFAHFRLSPDGSSLALAIDGANMSLWVYDISRATLSLLASTFDSAAPVWSPEGNQVVFASNRGATARNNLFLVAMDGSGEPEPLTTSDDGQIPYSWSPDGKTLVFLQQGDIWTLSMDGGGASQPFLQTKSLEGGPLFSPNGKWLAYESDESGRNEIHMRPFPGPGRRWQVSTDGGTSPTWSASGDELFYRNGDKMMVVQVETEEELRLGNPRLLFERRSETNSYDVLPDGQGFVMVDDSEAAPPPTQLILIQNWADELKRLVPTDN